MHQDLGKTVIESKDMPGFLVNRMLGPFINEAVFALMELDRQRCRTSTPGHKLGLNHPMGPLELSDFIGNDVMLGVMDVLYRGFGDPKFRAAPLLRQMVSAGHLGRKTGRGFYPLRREGQSAEPMTAAVSRPPQPDPFALSPEERQIRDTVRVSSPQRELAPTVAQRDEEERYDRSLFERDGLAGPRRPAVPRGVRRCGGMGMFAWILALRGDRRGGHGNGDQPLCVHILAQLPILAFGTDEQKQRFLPPDDGRPPSLGAFALTEPGAGLDAAALSLASPNGPR